MGIRVPILLTIFLLAGTAHSYQETIKAITLNVAGLPDFLTEESNSRFRMKSIAEKVKHYDLVLYQEDFYYSKYLEQGHFKHTIQGEKWTFWSLFWSWLRKSGLTIQTNLPVNSVSFHDYTECHGYFGNANDCWVPKGALCIRTQTPQDTLLDVCNTHMDAGNGHQDSNTRSSQFREFFEFIPSPPMDNIRWVRIEGGDFNERPGDSNMSQVLNQRNIIALNQVNDRQVDYLMVTHSENLQVDVLRAGAVLELDGLSDHPAVEIVLGLSY